MLFPTPPLPDNIKILCLIPARRAVITGISGSGPLGAEAHIAWLGQPSQESAFPAASDSGPGQCSGSGATRSGLAFRGLLRTSWTLSGSSREGAIVASEVWRWTSSEGGLSDAEWTCGYE